MAGKAFVFLNGYYHRDDTRLIRSRLRQTRPKPYLIAVDGGLSFLQKINHSPHYWLTDLDSSPRIKKGFLENTELLIHPSDKDKTDGELALDLCSEMMFTDITLFGWFDRRYETDHLLGNLMLFRNFTGPRRNIRLRFIDSRQEIIPLRDQAVNLTGYKGRRLSVVPLDTAITLTLRGTKYPARNLTLHVGQTIALRNRITAVRAGVKVMGAALAIIGDVKK